MGGGAVLLADDARRAVLTAGQEREKEERPHPFLQHRRRFRGWMLALVTHDVDTLGTGGKKRLRQISRACEDVGRRARFAVFEIERGPAQWARLKARLTGISPSPKAGAKAVGPGLQFATLRQVRHRGQGASQPRQPPEPRAPAAP